MRPLGIRALEFTNNLIYHVNEIVRALYGHRLRFPPFIQTMVHDDMVYTFITRQLSTR